MLMTIDEKLKEFDDQMATLAPSVIDYLKRAKAGDPQALAEMGEAHRRAAERLETENEEFEAELARR
jgi:hypothetical protein